MSDPLTPVPHVAIIIVNYNTPQDTIQCLESIFRLEYEAYVDIIVVDNGSEDDSVSLIGDYLSNEKEAVLISLEKNTGYAVGCNAGVRSVHSLQSSVREANSQKPEARSQKPDFYWFLNNDTILDLHALQSLLSSEQAHSEVKVWGSTIRDIDHAKKSLTQSRKERKEEKDLQCSGGFRYLPALSVPLPLKLDPETYQGQTCVRDERLAYISGISMFVRADVFDRRLLDETYFLYYEELALTRLAGGRKYLAWCPQSIVYHKGGSSTGGADPNRGRGSYAAHYYGNRSALRYTWKYHKLYFPLVFMFRLIMKTVLFIRYGEWKGFRPMMKAYWDFFSHNDTTITTKSDHNEV